MIENRVADVKLKFSLNDVIELLKHNMLIHVTDYNKAHEVYMGDLFDKLKDACEDVGIGKEVTITHNFGLQVPLNKEESYKELINLFEMSAKTGTLEIELTLYEADGIFNDNWEWLKASKAINASYSSRA